MDKLRALEYFVAAAQESSLSAAARRLDVSIAAVSKLVAALERSLGVALFDRNRHGITLTADGARYLESCGPLLDMLADADERVGGGVGRARGRLVVGAPEFVLHSCLADALPRFHARWPEIQLDLRIVNRVTDTQAEAVDVFVFFGWHDTPDFVHKRIGQTGFHILAAPAYWSARGIPRHPSELEHHECLCFRNPEGTLLDLWVFERPGESVEVPVRGWLSSGHRNVLLDAALAGEGVLRATGITSWHQVLAGRLVPVLEEWGQRHAPPASVLFRPSQRRTARVRAFVDFATELFRELEAQREPTPDGGPRERPQWQGQRVQRASRVGAKGRVDR